MVSLTDSTAEDGDRLSCYGTYAKAVCTLTGIAIKNDLSALALPEKMCAKCLNDLKQAVTFRRRCESSNDRLIKFVHKYLSETTTIFDFKDKLCEYVLSMNNSLPETSKSICSSPTENNLNTETIKTEVDDNVPGNNIEESKNNSSDYEEVEFLSTEYLEEIEELSLEKWFLNTNEQDTEMCKDMKKKAAHDLHTDCVDRDGADKEFCADTPLDKESKISNKPQVDGKVHDERNSDSDFYWPDSDDKKPRSKHMQEPTERLNRKDRQKKAAKRKISNFDILTDTESEEVDEYQPDEDSSSEDDADRIKKQKKHKKETSTPNNQCNICMKVLVTPYYLKMHIKRCHTDGQQKKFVCDQCAMKFWTKTRLKTHLACKHESLRYKCESCEYKCALKRELVKHNRTHTGERPFKCDKCQMTFHRHDCLHAHKKLHLERTIKCPQCPKKCHTKATMISHFNSIHHRMYRYDCSLCYATYALSFSLRKHLTEKHGIARKDQGKIQKVQLGIPEKIIENFSRLKNQLPT
ncbi:hypothetical protein O0L34_g10063 [Tuta absoluta]|nr:hypothetical protein O0L34_g10063 [Tuta absoluta]